jgi:threonine/homoserine/homoserine lactone efflux protein
MFHNTAALPGLPVIIAGSVFLFWLVQYASAAYLFMIIIILPGGRYLAQLAKQQP